MYGFEQAKQTLGLDTVFSFVAEKCVSILGQENIKNLQPLLDKNELLTKLNIVNETRLLQEKFGSLPIREFADIRVLLNKIEPQNSYLDIKECQEIQSFLEIIEDVNNYFKSNNTDELQINALISKLVIPRTLLTQLQFTIDPSGTIFDNASKDLKAIRKKLNQLRQDVNTKLERISSKYAEHLQEDFITLRDGRLVLPVREFSVTKISGIVHGQSSTGATRYVEPIAVVNLNNEIQELLLDEKKEIVRILTRLAAMIRDYSVELLTNLSILVELDALQARVLYGRQIQAVQPDIVDEHTWHIQNGKHPILIARIAAETIPINVEIGERYNILIISGPNAGGKTVALKTVGLLQLMLQCTLPIPVGEGSKFPVCQQVFVLIGDKQSLENDLSTFSSHINGLNEILRNVEEKALVLIDEIGIGTEPSGGAALAISVLEHLNKQDIATLVSTHQNQLKLFASETDGVENAAMQFDIDNLKPLFILESGVPGSSFTFDICKRYGLDEMIIERARLFEGDSNQEIDKLLKDITQKSAFYQAAVREMSVKQSQLDGLINLYERNSKELKTNRRKLEKEAKLKATEILEQANKKIEATIREIRESNADKGIVKTARKELSDLKSILQEKEKIKATNKLEVNNLQTGQKIRALNYNITGTISKIFTKRNEVEIEREGLKLIVKVDEIELLNEDGLIVVTKEQNNAVTGSTSQVGHELDLRGLEVNEALQQLDGYLDSAVHSDWNEVTVIHGKGTGALRKAVQMYLSKSKNIKTWRMGGYGEGDTGVTIVAIK